MAKAITKKCAYAVGKLTSSRVTVGSNTRVIKNTWTLPASAKNADNVARAEKQRVIWKFSKHPKGKTAPSHTVDVGVNTTSLEKGIVGTWGKTTYTRASFYPLTVWKIYTVATTVYLGNKKGWGKAVTSSFKFQKPRVPTLGAWSFNKENGVATINIKTNAGTDAYERYDTRYTLEVQNTRTGKKYNHVNTASTSTDFNVSFNVGDYQQLGYGQYIRLTLTAWARGFAGDSNKVTRTVYVAYPEQATITGTSVSSKDMTGKCTVNIKTNSTTAHPVDRVKLEYLANVTYASEAEIPASESWSDSGIMDDANCTALALSVANIMPEKGKYSWVRVKSYHLVEEVLYRYSKAVRVTGVETPAPTAADDDIVIIEAHAGSDGESAVVYLGWNEDGQDDSTGTELSWSDEENTWKSTKSPDSYDFTWSDGAVTVEIDGVERTFRDSAEIFIKGLSEGEKYYIKARRYMSGETETFSNYSNTATVVTSERPETIVASCNRYVAEGDALTVKWTFSGNGIQKAWQIVATNDKYFPAEGAVVYLPTQDGNVYILTEDTELVEGKTYYRIDDQNNYVIVEEPVEEDISTYYEKTGGVVQGKTYYTRSDEGEYTEVSNPVDEELDTYYEKTAGLIEGTVYYTRTGAEGNYEYTEVASPTASDIDDYFEVSKGAIVASGETSIGSAQITYDRMKTFAENGNVTLIVQASTGSGFVTSEEHRVSIINSPVIDVTVPATMTAQPFSFGVTSDRVCDLTVIVTSDGISGQFPQGVLTQTEGDTVHSDVYTPEWANEEAPFETTVTLPEGLDFWDTGSYTVNVVGIDRGTALQSKPVSTKFTVEWAHQAADPHDAITLTPINETDTDGNHHIAVELTLTAPTGSAETDVYDVYRMDAGNPQLIGVGLPLELTTADEYAPFGEDMTLYYRVAIRTVDGDVSFADIDYTMENDALRLDWAEGYLDLPYGNAIGDSYRKDVDIRQHIDGSIDGYWNNAVERKGSLNTSVIRIVQPDDIEKTRMLARYAGPVFVRTPNGSAYEADVQVTDLSVKNKAVTAIALDCTEINVTTEFQLPPIVSEEESE